MWLVLFSLVPHVTCDVRAGVVSARSATWEDLVSGSDADLLQALCDARGWDVDLVRERCMWDVQHKASGAWYQAYYGKCHDGSRISYEDALWKAMVGVEVRMKAKVSCGVRCE